MKEGRNNYLSITFVPPHSYKNLNKHFYNLSMKENEQIADEKELTFNYITLEQGVVIYLMRIKLYFKYF